MCPPPPLTTKEMLLLVMLPYSLNKTTNFYSYSTEFQGSVLAPIMFLVYIKDIQKGVRATLAYFADDTKLMKKTETIEDCKKLQTR